MDNRLTSQAGTAVFWKALQLGGEKSIFFLRTVVLARLLVPDDFGLLAVATITVGFFLCISEFGMIPVLVQLPEVNEEHYDSAWTVILLRALSITCVLLISAPWIAAFFAEPRATQVIRALALRPLIEATASIKVAELTRKLRFKSLAQIRLPAVLADTAVSIALSREYGVWALVAGALAGAIVGVLMSYILAPHRPRFVVSKAATRPLIQYGRWVFATGLVAAAGSSLLQVVISRRLGSAELGIYFLAAKLAFLPYETASQVISSVAFPLYARLQADLARARRAFQSVLIGMAALVLPAYGLIIVVAPSLVADVLGPRWAGTVPVIRLLALVGITGLFGDAVEPLLRGFGYPNRALLIEVVQSTLIIAVAWGLTGTYGLLGAPLAWWVAVAVSQVLSGLFLQKILKRPFTRLWVPTTAIVTASGVGVGVAFLFDKVFEGIAGLLLSLLAAAGAIAVVMRWCDHRYNLGLLSDLARLCPPFAPFIRTISQSKGHPI